MSVLLVPIALVNGCCAKRMWGSSAECRRNADRNNTAVSSPCNYAGPWRPTTVYVLDTRYGVEKAADFDFCQKRALFLFADCSVPEANPLGPPCHPIRVTPAILHCHRP